MSTPDLEYDEFEADDTCQRCGGAGYYHDCGEDTCCCADTEADDDTVMCPDCGGTGCER